MAEHQNPAPLAEARAVLDRADSLMERNRAARVSGLRADVTPLTAIPTLTDVVASPPPAGPAPNPAPAATTTARRPSIAGIGTAELVQLEDTVHQRLQQRLDRDLASLLEHRLLPELAGSLDHALQHIAAELKGSIRDMVRSAIDETIAQRLQNRPLELPPSEDK